MKLTELRIAPENAYRSIGAQNRMKAVVKLDSDGATVEAVLSEDTMLRMLDLCAEEIAANAKRNVDEFVAAVSSIEGRQSTALLSD